MWLGPKFKAPLLILIGVSLSSLAPLLFAVEPSGAIYWACQFVSFVLLPWGIDL